MLKQRWWTGPRFGSGMWKTLGPGLVSGWLFLGCHTSEGMKQDLNEAGETIEDAAEDAADAVEDAADDAEDALQ